MPTLTINVPPATCAMPIVWRRRHSGRSFEHRRQWIKDRPLVLAVI
ncbi:MAG: hypothetical protein WBO14_18720 [Gammaproteobacteria bacterium]